METGLEELWKNLSLTSDEQQDVIIEKKWIEEIVQARKNCLFGRMVINRVMNMEAMKGVLQKNMKVIFWNGDQRSWREILCFPF